MNAIIIDPGEGEICTVFRSLRDGHMVEVILGLDQEVSIQRGPEGKPYSIRWNNLCQNWDPERFRTHFGIEMSHR
jgi:hypothetical protein